MTKRETTDQYDAEREVRRAENKEDIRKALEHCSRETTSTIYRMVTGHNLPFKPTSYTRAKLAVKVSVLLEPIIENDRERLYSYPLVSHRDKYYLDDVKAKLLAILHDDYIGDWDGINRHADNLMYTLRWLISTGRMPYSFVRLITSIKPSVMAAFLIQNGNKGTTDAEAEAIKAFTGWDIFVEKEIAEEKARLQPEQQEAHAVIEAEYTEKNQAQELPQVIDYSPDAFLLPKQERKNLLNIQLDHFGRYHMSCADYNAQVLIETEDESTLLYMLNNLLTVDEITVIMSRHVIPCSGEDITDFNAKPEPRTWDKDRLINNLIERIRQVRKEGYRDYIGEVAAIIRINNRKPEPPALPDVITKTPEPAGNFTITGTFKDDTLSMPKNITPQMFETTEDLYRNFEAWRDKKGRACDLFEYVTSRDMKAITLKKLAKIFGYSIAPVGYVVGGKYPITIKKPIKKHWLACAVNDAAKYIHKTFTRNRQISIEQALPLGKLEWAGGNFFQVRAAEIRNKLRIRRCRTPQELEALLSASSCIGTLEYICHHYHVTDPRSTYKYTARELILRLVAHMFPEVMIHTQALPALPSNLPALPAHVDDKHAEPKPQEQEYFYDKKTDTALNIYMQVVDAHKLGIMPIDEFICKKYKLPEIKDLAAVFDVPVEKGDTKSCLATQILHAMSPLLKACNWGHAKRNGHGKNHTKKPQPTAQATPTQKPQTKTEITSKANHTAPTKEAVNSCSTREELVALFSMFKKSEIYSLMAAFGVHSSFLQPFRSKNKLVSYCASKILYIRNLKPIKRADPRPTPIYTKPQTTIDKRGQLIILFEEVA